MWLNICCTTSYTSALPETILLEFRDSIVNLQQWRTANRKVGWDSTPVCTWSGVRCSDDGSSVVEMYAGTVTSTTPQLTAPFQRHTLRRQLQHACTSTLSFPPSFTQPIAAAVRMATHIVGTALSHTLLITQQLEQQPHAGGAAVILV